MLILYVEDNQRVFVDKGRIEVKVLKAKKDGVYLGFSAPRDIEIDREKIFFKKKKNKKITEEIEQLVN